MTGPSNGMEAAPDKTAETVLHPVPKPNQFLPKASYRKRRLEDALKLWPLLGVVAFVLPTLWTIGAQSIVAAMLYLFVVWATLLVGAGLLSRAESKVPPSSASLSDQAGS